MAFEQLEAPAAADGVGDPRADHRAEQRRRARPRASSGGGGRRSGRVGDSEAGEQHHDLGRDRDAGARRSPSARRSRAARLRATKCEVSLTSVSEIEASTSIGRPTIPSRRRVTVQRRMRVWVDLTNSPHVLVMRPVIERLRADGHEVQVTARDFAQTLELCERFGIDHTAIGHHRGERLPPRPPGWPRARGAAALGARGRRAPARRFDLALGHGSNDVTRRRRRCCGSPARRCSTTSGRPSSTTSTAGWRAPSSCPTRSRRERLARYGARGKLRRYAGLKEEYYLADFEPDAAVLAELGARPRAADRGRAHAAGGLALPPLRERPVRARCSSGCARPPRDGVQTVVLPRVDAQREELRARRRLHRARARDRRAVADRLRRPGDLRRRHDEPRGGRARDARLHDLRRGAWARSTSA